MPSERRALDLAEAYRFLVAKQRWDLGRDVLVGGALPVFAEIENGDTELVKAGRVYMDGRVWLDWGRAVGVRYAYPTAIRLPSCYGAPAKAVLLRHFRSGTV